MAVGSRRRLYGKFKIRSNLLWACLCACGHWQLNEARAGGTLMAQNCQTPFRIADPCSFGDIFFMSPLYTPLHHLNQLSTKWPNMIFFCNTALIIRRMGCWGPLYYIYSKEPKEPQNSTVNYLDPCKGYSEPQEPKPPPPRRMPALRWHSAALLPSSLQAPGSWGHLAAATCSTEGTHACAHKCVCVLYIYIYIYVCVCVCIWNNTHY